MLLLTVCIYLIEIIKHKIIVYLFVIYYFYKNRYTMWQQILRYFYLAKKDPNAPNTSFVKAMHGMNRISIFMFLFAIIVMIVRYIKRH